MPRAKRLLALTLPMAAGLTFAAVLLGLLAGSAGRAAAAPLRLTIARYVAPSGSDSANDCTDSGNPCQTIQWALDQAGSGDEIRVASGVYTSAAGTVANITQSVTLQGGWNSAFSHNDPASQPTVLDGQGLQPVVVISPTALPSGAQMTPTVEGLVIQHGQGQAIYCGSGALLPAECGGGLVSVYADPLIVNNVISDNIGANNTFGFGGGIYIFNASTAAVISGNLVYGNLANSGGTGLGGGIAEHSSQAVIQGNRIWRNHDSLLGTGLGAGIKLYFSHASILGNDLRENVSSFRGGGIHANDSSGTLTISGNSILSNTAGVQGGGVLINGPALGALIVSNTLGYNSALSPSTGRGGGIRISSDSSSITIQHNSFYSNVAAWGGGSAIDVAAPALVDANDLRQNQNGQWGAALVLSGTAAMTATNNVIADNLGAGIEAVDFGQSVSVVNNTVVGSRAAISGAAGSGVLVQFDTAPAGTITATLVNNLVLNSAACGIDLPSSALVVISHHNDVRGNGNNYCGTAVGGGNISADPLFVNAAAGNYHLSIGSPAINSGSNAEAPAVDRDGVSRPRGRWVDMGAYEFPFVADLMLPLLER